jgi:hypothetical protein
MPTVGRQQTRFDSIKHVGFKLRSLVPSCDITGNAMPQTTCCQSPNDGRDVVRMTANAATE